MIHSEEYKHFLYEQWMKSVFNFFFSIWVSILILNLILKFEIWIESPVRAWVLVILDSIISVVLY